MQKSFLVIATILISSTVSLHALAMSDSYTRENFLPHQEPAEEVATITPMENILDGLTIPAAKPAPRAAALQTPTTPIRILAPSIGLNAPIQKVGVNAKKEMDVPAGTTNNVGWYAPGTIPGDVGSAVLDAHVFAAFSKLDQINVGDSLYVKDAAGASLRFVVTQRTVYPLADVPLQTLFNRNDGRYLNLITCAGSLTPDHSTYDHRLIVYARLAEAS